MLSSCVPQKKFLDLKKDYEQSQQKEADCNKKLAALEDSTRTDRKTIKKHEENIAQLNKDTALLGSTNRKLNSLYGQVNSAYERLLQKVKELESQNTVRTQELSEELLNARKKLKEREEDVQKKSEDIKKQNADLKELKAELSKLQEDLEKRSKRVAELETVLNQKDSAVKALRNTVSNSLLSFKDKGLSVNIKNGKVYVSLEEKLLFESGKYQVNPTGRDALMQISKVLNNEGDISVLVEGHTDNVPYKGSTGGIKDNWDLSVLRATEVVRIMSKEGKVDPARITAAGRGDTTPIASNATPEGRGKNRRTEIILSPKLSELFKILEQN